jgi:hypothetical protein
MRSVHATLQFIDLLRSDTHDRLEGRIGKQVMQFYEFVKKTYQEIAEGTIFDIGRPPSMMFVWRIGSALLRLDQLAEYEFVEGSSRLAEVGAAGGHFGWFRKKGEELSPSEEEDDEDEDDEDEDDEEESDESD